MSTAGGSELPRGGPDLLVGSRGFRRRFASIEAAAVAGIVCAIAWSLSLRGLLAAPAVGASEAEIVAYYAEPRTGTYALIWLQVLVLGTLAFLWFVGVIRGRLGENEPKLFGTVFFGASILLAGSLFIGASLLASPAVLVAVGDVAPSPDAAALSRAAAATILSVFTPRVATLVMFATAGLGRVTGALPRWLVVVTYVIGAVSFVNVTISTPYVYSVPAWIALVSIVLLVRRPPHGLELPRAPTGEPEPLGP